MVILPNGSIVTCTKLMQLHWDPSTRVFKVQDPGVNLIPGTYDHLACIDNDNCMAASSSGSTLTGYNPSTGVGDPQATLLSASVAGIGAFRRSSIYFVAMTTGAYVLYSRAGSLLTTTPVMLFNLPASTTMQYGPVMTDSIYGQDAVVVGGHYEASGVQYESFLAGLTIFSNTSTTAQLEHSFSLTADIANYDGHVFSAYRDDAKFVAVVANN